MLLNTEAELKTLKKKCSDRPIIVLFWASWDENSTLLKNMMAQMPQAYNKVQLAYVDCDESELVDVLDVDTVQTVAVIHPDIAIREMEKKAGVKPEQLTELVQGLNKHYEEWYETEKKKAFRDIDSHVATHPFFIFVKGSKEQPRCKFTRKLVETLAKFGYDYATFDILQDERIRQWVKVYTNWPTIPQIFINQKFIGGLDIVTDLIDGEEFDEMVPETCKQLRPAAKARQIVDRNALVALINGSIASPADEASQKLVQALNASKVEYTALDVSAEPEYLKAFAEGQQVPYVFFQGKAACALEGLSQLLESSELKSSAQTRPPTAVERIEKLLKENDVMLFMKGTPSNPQCGFSQKTAALLSQYDGLNYNFFNIFEDNELREALKKHSNWPTYP